MYDDGTTADVGKLNVVVDKVPYPLAISFYVVLDPFAFACNYYNTDLEAKIYSCLNALVVAILSTSIGCIVSHPLYSLQSPPGRSRHKQHAHSVQLAESHAPADRLERGFHRRGKSYPESQDIYSLSLSCL